MDVGLTDPWITLTIKAPNQQIDDQTVKCKLDWSVAKLKVYIHEIYPNKPKMEDQRLIYSGQLLTDSIILKDVLRPYDDDGQLNRTVHLVCASSSCSVPFKEKSKNELKSVEAKSIESNSEGTCKNNVSSEVNKKNCSFNNLQEDSVRTSNQTQSSLNNNDNNILVTPEQIAAEQIIWMNRMYAIQMAQYWNSVASSFGSSVPLNIQTPADNELPNNTDLLENNNQPQAQNLVPGENVNEPNQDWLDWLYISCRIFIFLSVIYFYSSPGRFIAVAGFAVLLYLYKIGFLHIVQDLNRRRNIALQQEQVVDDNRNLPNEVNGNTDDATTRQNERLMTTLWTLISTFFTSLIPQAPDVI